jgi:HEAT repeat protein
LEVTKSHCGYKSFDMKTEPRRFRTKLIHSACIVAAGILLSLSARADGCFVVPKFVWDKHRDINEPTQKAIIAYDGGREDVILQVKYDGPVEEFGWLVPVPNVPTIREGSMECFYELSKYTQQHFEPHWSVATMSLGMNIGGLDKSQESPIKVLQTKTVGAYRVAVLSAKNAGALENWLGANGFYLPPDKGGVIDFYVKQGWCFVAAKINLSKTAGWEVISGTPKMGANTKANLKEKLSSGELRPLHLSFASDKCVFPLKISSINGKSSEVQIYLLSAEPLVEKGMFEIKMAGQHRWRTNMLAEQKELSAQMQASRAALLKGGAVLPPSPEPENRLSSASIVNNDELVPYVQVSWRELPVCSREIALPDKKSCWLTKQTWTFRPEEMRDLEFVPAIPVFTALLGEDEGAFAAANLAGLGANGTSALLVAMDSANPTVRANALSVSERMFLERDSSLTTGELMKRLPALLKDKNPEVRLHAIEAAAARGDDHGKFFDIALDLLRDDDPEISGAALNYLSHNGASEQHIPLFHQMLVDTNSTVQMAGIRLLLRVGVTPSREELLPLFRVPRLEVAGAAVGVLQQEHVSGEEAKPLLQNSLWMVRLMGLKILAANTNEQSVEFAIPLLRDSEQFVRFRAHDMLVDLTGQAIPVEQPDRWEKWWAENKTSFVLNPQQIAERRSARVQQRRDEMRRRGQQSELLLNQPQNQR